ncbi:MAG: hypothetical protein E6G94_03345 [Alphaproteobacteria bacterium]|nr:MAG: hypothetical protein E6G94_03345 [Alphaproteobacteria bacterium]
MANDDLKSFSDVKLDLEFERLDGQREVLQEAIDNLGPEIARLEISVKQNAVITGGGVLLTIFGLAAAAITPVAIVGALSGFGLGYFGGKGCAEDAAGIADLQRRLNRDRERMQGIADRMLAIDSERRGRAP